MHVNDRTNGGSGDHFLHRILKAARERAGLSQAEFAAKCGVTQPAVAHWESGRAPLQEQTLERGAQALGMTVERMLLMELKAASAAAAKARRRRKGKHGDSVGNGAPLGASR